MATILQIPPSCLVYLCSLLCGCQYQYELWPISPVATPHSTLQKPPARTPHCSHLQALLLPSKQMVSWQSVT